MGNIFTQTFKRLSQDHYLDRRDWQELRETASVSQSQQGSDSWLAQQTLSQLDQYQGRTQIQFGIPGQTLNFVFTPAYSERDPLPGATWRERLAYVSQKDNFDDTTTDVHRCSAASLVNAWFLLGGEQASLAYKLGVPMAQHGATYGAIHRLQDALYRSSNSDGQDGLSSSYTYTHRGEKILSAELTQEAAAAVHTLGLKPTVLMGSTLSTRYQRQESVEAFWQQDPNGVLLAGIHLDPHSGSLQAVDQTHDMNHNVLIYREAGQTFLLDTGASDNGQGNSRHKLSADEIQAFVYQTPAHIIGLTR